MSVTPSANWHYCFFKIILKSWRRRISLSSSHFLSLSLSPLLLLALCRVFNMQIGHFCPRAIFFGRLLKYANASNKNCERKRKGKAFIWAPGVFHSKKQMIFSHSYSLFLFCLLYHLSVCLIKTKKKKTPCRQKKNSFPRMGCCCHIYWT